MTGRPLPNSGEQTVSLRLDPVCPFSWNTARWLTSAAEVTGHMIDVRLMSLAILNDGRKLPAQQQAQMRDSRLVGRLMSALSDELGSGILRAAYFAFARLYFDQSMPVSDELAERVIRAVCASSTTPAALDDTSYDISVAKSHHAGQSALGGTGGSPLVTIGDRTVFGPVLTSVPDASRAPALFDAISALVRAPEFSEISRPRKHIHR